MKSFLPKSLLASLALGAISATSADAAVIVTLPTPSLAGSLVISNDITFTLTGSLGASAFMEIVFDEWVTSDGSFNNFFDAAVTPNVISFAKNGVAMSSQIFVNSGYFLTDNNVVTTGDITPNDGFMEFIPGVALSPGDTFTLKAATYVMPAGSLAVGFNPQANQTFTGNAFLAFDVLGGGARLSANTSVNAVPEPSRALLLLCGVCTLAFRRRRVA